MGQLSCSYFGHLSIIRTFSFGRLGQAADYARTFASSSLKTVRKSDLDEPTFLKFIGEASRALERRRQVGVLLRRFPLLAFSSSPLLNLLGVQQVRRCFRPGVGDDLVLLVGRVVDLVSVDDMSLLLPPLLLLLA